MLWSPLSKRFGRCACIFWSMVLTLCVNIWSAEMTKPHQYNAFVVSRLFGGLFGSAPTTGSSLLEILSFCLTDLFAPQSAQTSLSKSSSSTTAASALLCTRLAFCSAPSPVVPSPASLSNQRHGQCNFGTTSGSRLWWPPAASSSSTKPAGRGRMAKPFHWPRWPSRVGRQQHISSLAD